MRIQFAMLAGALLVGGCASVSDVRQNPPLVDLYSDRPAQEVAECIRDGWQDTKLVGGTVGGILQSTAGNFSVIAPNAEIIWHVVDVKPSGTGSKVRYSFYRTWQSPPSSVPRIVNECAKAQ